MENLSKRQLADRWQCSLRTVERNTRQYGLIPVGVSNRLPIYSAEDVLAMERRKNAAELAAYLKRKGARVLTASEALKKAGRKGGGK